MTWTRIDKEYLAEQFDIDRMDLMWMPREQVVNIPPCEISVKYKNLPLYSWVRPSGELQILSSENIRGDIIEVLDRTGLYPLEIEFNSWGGEMKEGADSNVRVLDLPALHKIHDFASWFEGRCSLLGDKIYLVPDTNFLRRLYYTNFLAEILSSSELNHPASVVIPRLCILEIENKYNRSSSSKSGNKNNEVSVSIADYNLGKEKRIGLSSIKEVIAIKKNGGRTNSNVSGSLIESFSRASGEKNADHWIRREIIEFISSVTARFTRDDKGETIVENSGVIFLTCDIMNSLAAVSENINTFYFLRSEPNRLSVPTAKHFANLVYDTAIQFGECTCHIKYFQEGTINIVGMWKGKTTYDWMTDRLLIYNN